METKPLNLIGIQRQAGQFGSQTAPKVGSTGQRDTRLWKACQDMEGIFMSYLVKSMEQSLPKSDAGGSGMVQLMFSRVMGDAISQGGGIGMAEMLYQNLGSNIQLASESPEKGGAPEKSANRRPLDLEHVKIRP